MKLLMVGMVVLPLFAQPGPGPHGGMAGRGPMGGHLMERLPSTMTSESNPMTPEKVALGRMLFYDPRLSKDDTVSCNSCHDLARYGVDGLAFSLGVGGLKGTRNSPTVYHAAGQVLQFWDGRAADVEEQAKGPALNPVEMAMASGADVESKLRSVPGYARAFALAFPEQAQPVTFDNVGLAIGAFERGLTTPSRWDRFLAGDQRALESIEFAGFHEFMHAGCATCHNGPFVGGRSLQKLGAMRPWPDQSDVGREAVTKAPTDHMVFKVPTLRNVGQTGPYFHDGSVMTLDEAVRRMAVHQLGLSLNETQVSRIVAWLNALTGEIPQEYIRKPALPN